MNNNNFGGLAAAAFGFQNSALGAFHRTNSLTSGIEALQKMVNPFDNSNYMKMVRSFTNSSKTSMAMHIAEKQNKLWESMLPSNAFDTLYRIGYQKNLFQNDLIAHVRELKQFSIPHPLFKTLDNSVFLAISQLVRNDECKELEIIEDIFEEFSTINFQEISTKIHVKEYLLEIYERVKARLYSLPETKAGKVIKEFLLNLIFILDIFLQANNLGSLNSSSYNTSFCISDTKIYRNASLKNRPVGEVINGQSVKIIKSNIKWMMILVTNNSGESTLGWALKDNFQK